MEQAPGQGAKRGLRPGSTSRGQARFPVALALAQPGVAAREVGRVAIFFEPELAHVIVAPLQQAVMAYLDAVIGSLNEIVASATSLERGEGDSSLIDREVELLETLNDMLATDACKQLCGPICGPS